MKSCQQVESLSHAQLTSPSPQLQQHLQGCEECSSLVHAVLETRAMLPRRAPSAARVSAMKSALRESMLAELPAPKKSRLPQVVFALAASVALAFATWSITRSEKTPAAKPTKEEATAWVQLAPQPGANFSQESTPTEEIISLQKGKLELRVNATKPSQRLRMRTEGGDELVTMQAHFVVTASYVFEEVEVKSGTIELFPAVGEKRLLSAGEVWHAPIIEPTTLAAAQSSPKAPEAAPPNPTKTPAPVVKPPAPTSAPKVTSPAPAATQPASAPRQEVSFQEGVAAQRSGKFLEAAALYEEAAKDPSLAPEALYFRGFCLIRAGATSEAKTALAFFLEKYPASSHAGEAHAALGWILLKEGDLDSAQSHFTKALEDKNTSIRENAQRGLQRVEALRATP